MTSNVQDPTLLFRLCLYCDGSGVVGYGRTWFDARASVEESIALTDGPRPTLAAELARLTPLEVLGRDEAGLRRALRQLGVVGTVELVTAEPINPDLCPTCATITTMTPAAIAERRRRNAAPLVERKAELADRVYRATEDQVIAAEGADEVIARLERRAAEVATLAEHLLEHVGEARRALEFFSKNPVRR